MMVSFKQNSAVFDYFEMPDDTSGKYRAKCKHCTTTLATSGMKTIQSIDSFKAKPICFNRHIMFI